MNETRRKVYGSDLIVTYAEVDDTVFVKQIHSWQGNNGRFSSNALLETLDFTPDMATMQFLKNNNLHNAGKGLRGALLIINLTIGMIVKAVGSFILFNVILPRRLAGFKIIDLGKKDRFYGFFLQQIRGPRIAALSSRRHGKTTGQDLYPYCIEGHVYMDPSGPDFCVSEYIANIPKTIAEKFETLRENLCLRDDNKKTTSHIRNLRKSSKANVLYVADSKSRVDVPESGDCFYIPVGAPIEEVECPWKKGQVLYQIQLFLPVTKEQVMTISKWGKISSREWRTRLFAFAGNKRSNLLKLIVPSINWSLNIVLVEDKKCLNDIYNALTFQERHPVVCGDFEVLFVIEDKSAARTRGVSLSTWVLGDPQVSRTRVTYEYVRQYRSTYGSGYGSRRISSCLDSVNSYRDKRLNPRAHLSPLIHERDIAKHQYFSARKQQSCLLQMKLETILHSLTSDITFVAERMNPYMVGITSGLCTKLIATTGQSLYSFCNGLHTDTGDRISGAMKSALFAEVPEEWNRMISFAHLSFPSTLGYQHVWKDPDDAKKHFVQHYFMEPGLGLAVSLEDSICHHFMSGAFAHCSSVCVVELKNDDDEDEAIVTIRNDDDIFSVFAWGISANRRMAKGNIGRQNSLADHRLRQQLNRSRASATNPVVLGAGSPTDDNTSGSPSTMVQHGTPTDGVSAAAAVARREQGAICHNEEEDDVSSDDSEDDSEGFIKIEDDEYEWDKTTEKKTRL